MKEYIEREAAVKTASKYGCDNGSALGRHSGLADCIADEIQKIPAADVVERKRGEWIKVGESCGVDLLECPVCHTIHAQDGDAFCRDCGADMRSHHDSLCDQNEEVKHG